MGQWSRIERGTGSSGRARREPIPLPPVPRSAFRAPRSLLLRQVDRLLGGRLVQQQVVVEHRRQQRADDWPDPVDPGVLPDALHQGRPDGVREDVAGQDLQMRGPSAPGGGDVMARRQPRPGRSDADRNCISNIRAEGLSYPVAAQKLLFLMNESRRLKLSGVQLKEGLPQLPGS